MNTLHDGKSAHSIANRAPWALGLCVLTACSGAGDVDPTPSDTSSGTTTPAGGEEEFRTIISADWELEPGSEEYMCAWVTVQEDMYVGGFEPINPVGTHHTVLTVSELALQPDGVAPCEVTTVAPRSIYGTGVGTQPLESPPGIATKLEAGNQLVLNLHLFNASTTVLRGTSGTRVRTMDPADVQELAEGIAAGPLRLTVPPGRSTQNGQCTFDHDSTIFRVVPHMHQTGVHMRVVAHSTPAGTVVLHDGPYDFEQQLAYPVEMIAMKAGDVVDIACTYENDTGQTLHFGESSLDEMCIAGLARFPAGDQGNSCTH